VIQNQSKSCLFIVSLSKKNQMIPIYFDPSRTIDSNLMTWNSTLVQQQQIQPQQQQMQQQQQLPQFVIQPQQQDAGLWQLNPNNNIANQQWDAELTEDLFRMVMNELDATQPAAVQPTLTEVNPQHNDDDILAGIWEINDYTTDAVSASNNNTMEDRLTRRMNQMTLSDNQKIQEEQSGKNTKTYPRSIAMGLARALRSYAVTGNMTHILMRLHHLFAIQSDDGDK